MTNYLVQSFSGFVSEASSKLRRKPWFALSLFPIFRNYSGDFTIGIFRAWLCQSAVFSF